MGTLVKVLSICLQLGSVAAPAQGSPPTVAGAPAQPNPLSAHQKRGYAIARAVLLRSAELMPAENYGFKPTDGVRSFGQILGHVADSQYDFCSIVLGEKNPSPNIEETKTSKAELIAALEEAFAYGERAYARMTDSSAVQMVKYMGRDQPKLGVLINNNIHTSEHQGNLVTYLRMKGIVPPTSDEKFMQEVRKSAGR